uniref:Uncharacterized protein n=1 Tax=viral metagenome TaxID=1070528 RepID=A0A6H1ZNV5_9ZZZZ
MRKVQVQKVLLSTESASIAVASTAVVYTKAMKLAFGDYFALSYKAVSAAGSPDVKIELEQSYELPTTEGSSDAEWVEPENMADIETNLTVETQKHKSLSPIPLPYGRFKITGNAGNAADTILTMFLSIQEEL